MDKFMPLSAPFNSITTRVMSSIDRGAPYPPMTSANQYPARSPPKVYPTIPSPTRSEQMLVEEEKEVKEEEKPLDANRYATKKTIAQGMLDIALLTANASQLKYVLTIGAQHQFYTLMVALITISIVLQVVVGVLCLSLNLMRDCRLHLEEYTWSALLINYTTMGCSMVITALNLMISAFDPTMSRFISTAETLSDHSAALQAGDDRN